MRTKDRRYKDSEWNTCERVDGKEDKINISTYFEGWREDGGNVNEGIHEGIWKMDRRGCGLGTRNGRSLLEEDKVEAFGSLNVISLVTQH